MDTKTVADGLARRHETRNPFLIAKYMGFITLPVRLVGMRGFQHRAKRRRFIYVNSDLDEQQQRLVCAHELAHHLFHRNLNRIFMDRHTASVTQKFENEANQFSVELIYSDDELLPYLNHSFEYAAEYMGVNYELAEYRMREVKSRYPTEDWGC